MMTGLMTTTAPASHGHQDDAKCLTPPELLEETRAQAESFTVGKSYYVDGIVVEAFIKMVSNGDGLKGIKKLWIVYLEQIGTNMTTGLVYFVTKEGCANSYMQVPIQRLEALFMDMRYDVTEGLPPLKKTPSEDDDTPLSVDEI